MPIKKALAMEDSYANQLKDLDWALGFNRFGLRAMGVWPVDEAVRTKSLRTLLRVPFMMLVLLLGLILPQMSALTMVIKSLPLVIDNLLTSCPAFTSLVKLFCFWTHTDVLRPVVQSVTRDWLRPKRDWELQRMRKQARRARLITIADYSIMASCYVVYMVPPMLGYHLRTINNITDYGDHYLLAQSYFPYDYSASPQRQLTYLLQLVASFFIAMAVSVPDDYFGALVYHASAQFEILGEHIENLVTVEGNGDSNVMSSRNVDRKLRSFIDRHIHLYTMISAVEKSFGYAIAAQLFCMSIMVCCLGFMILSILNNSEDKPTPHQVVMLIGTLFTILVHTLVDCFASEILASRSARIFFHIYCSKWYMLPQEQKRCLIPMMIMSKAPRQIIAGKILYLSLTTYCSIIKSTAGYISMLIAVNTR